MTELEKSFNPQSFEKRWFDHWLRLGVFTAGREPRRPPFSMVIPPPNITGRLHMGHALNNTLQDIVARWRRMKGDDVLWLPGTDHAGIATQMVVDRHLAAEGKSREALGRAAFVERVWQWKEEYGGAIVEQLKQLGCSCDWTRQRFTLDPALSRAVREAFVRLYEDGLIYRDKYIVNWCPGCRTAVSDLEVIPQETQGHLWTIAYPLEDGTGEVRVATTRPETMLGDTGVAVHPDDGRYKSLVGRNVILPLVGRPIPIVADPFVEREFGTGAVKVTPAHDPNDFEAAARTGLRALSVMDESGRMNDNVPPAYRGLDRFEARKRVVEDLKSEGRLVSVVDHLHNVGRCQRCNTVIEPYLSTQWFVRIKPLADDAIRAVAEGRVRFIPPHWINSYNEWMGKIHDWCISRQLWWGHQIPAWYCDACGHLMVARDAPARCAGCGGTVRQDPDVLDTWFSSSLWPFSTLGWPEHTPDLGRYYPTTCLVTGFDILFFWVARMIMMGLKFMNEIPFHSVYITGMVRDAEGQKMSKTRGNVIDPLELVARHGTDALRFTMAAMATPGADLPLAEERMTGYRAFANKLWNAARFVLINLGEDAASGRTGPPALPPREKLTLPDRWILSRLARLTAAIDASLVEFRFDETANALYQFLWHEYCDWYVEMAKPALMGEDAAGRARAQSVLVHVLERCLRLLHPVMPFLTEELWQRLPHEGDTIALAPYPDPDPAHIDDEAEAEVTTLMEVVGRIRNLRAELNIDPGRRLTLLYRAGAGQTGRLLRENQATVATLARLESLRATDDLDHGGPAARAVAPGLDLAVPLAGILDLETERRRLAREIDKLAKERDGHARKLGNADFLAKAQPEVVAKARRIHQELDEKIERLHRTVAGLTE